MRGPVVVVRPYLRALRAPLPPAGQRGERPALRAGRGGELAARGPGSAGAEV